MIVLHLGWQIYDQSLTEEYRNSVSLSGEHRSTSEQPLDSDARRATPSRSVAPPPHYVIGEEGPVVRLPKNVCPSHL
jgi:hypothetical protein